MRERGRPIHQGRLSGLADWSRQRSAAPLPGPPLEQGVPACPAGSAARSVPSRWKAPAWLPTQGPCRRFRRCRTLRRERRTQGVVVASCVQSRGRRSAPRQTCGQGTPTPRDDNAYACTRPSYAPLCCATQQVESAVANTQDARARTAGWSPFRQAQAIGAPCR